MDTKTFASNLAPYCEACTEVHGRWLCTEPAECHWLRHTRDTRAIRGLGLGLLLALPLWGILAALLWVLWRWG